jgi:hypothetical protein
MPKWAWIVAAALAAYYFFFMRRPAVTVPAPAPSPLPLPPQYGQGYYGTGYGAAPTIGNPSGGTSVSQDVLNYVNAAGQATGIITGILGALGVGGGGGGGGGGDGGGGSTDGWTTISDWGG